MKPLPKSLHTITVVKNVAAHLYGGNRQGYSYPGAETALTADALAILGYVFTGAAVRVTRDDTLVRCVTAVATLLRGV